MKINASSNILGYGLATFTVSDTIALKTIIPIAGNDEFLGLSSSPFQIRKKEHLLVVMAGF
jgi:hypothetical protein